MVMSTNSQLQKVLLGTFVTLAMLWSGMLHAQEDAAPSDYAMEQFGSPPTIPEGPLSEELHASIK